MWSLALVFGGVVGLSLGLTGGGGSIFAVPLLVYGLAVPPREAVGVSLAAVGATALVGALERLRARQVEVRPGLLFAVAGMVGAPFGSWLAGQITETLLLLLFAILMLLIAARMWLKSSVKAETRLPSETAEGPSCRRDPAGNLLLTSRCAVVLSVVGVLTGVLSGLFGVGGGFVIVPALVMFSGMRIHRAIATSLLVIALISASGVSGHLLADGSISPRMTATFVVGGVAGMFLGSWLARRIAGPALQKGFAAAIVGVAVFVIVRTLV